MRPHRGASAALKALAAGLRPRPEPKGGRQGWHCTGTQCEGNDRDPSHMLLPSQFGMHIRFGSRPVADGLCPDGANRAFLPHELSAERIDFSAPPEAELFYIGPECGLIRPCPSRSAAGMSSGLRLGCRGHAFRPRRNLPFDPFKVRPRLPVRRFHPREQVRSLGCHHDAALFGTARGHCGNCVVPGL